MLTVPEPEKLLHGAVDHKPQSCDNTIPQLEVEGQQLIAMLYTARPHDHDNLSQEKLAVTLSMPIRRMLRSTHAKQLGDMEAPSCCF